MIRRCVNLSDGAAKVWDDYQASHPGLKRDPALDALILEYGGKEPEEPTRRDVEVSQKGDLILVRAGLKTLLSTPKSDAANAFQVAVAAVPSGGSLGIGEGLYELPAPYPVALDADGGNIFYCCIPILDKSMHIFGAGAGKTVLKLAAWQRSASRHVVMMLIRGTGPMAPGYSSFSVDGLTLDGNVKYQYSGTQHDGEALILVGSARRNGKYANLELRNSHGAGLYLGNNGGGSGTNELIRIASPEAARTKGSCSIPARIAGWRIARRGPARRGYACMEMMTGRPGGRIGSRWPASRQIARLWSGR